METNQSTNQPINQSTNQPKTLTEALPTQPQLLQLRVMLLAQVIAVIFVVHKSTQAWKIRPIPMLIVISFLVRKYIHFYLLIAGVSLLIDAVDVLRFLIGDGQIVT